MNREIKFRVWDTDKNRMFWPKSNVVAYNDQFCYPDLCQSFDVKDGGYGGPPPEDQFSYKGEQILQQFTNCLDCNKKEIYEGDIVRIHHDHHIREGKLGVVLMGKYEFAQWCVAHLWKDLTPDSQALLSKGEDEGSHLYRVINGIELCEEDSLSSWGFVEVVGNIFETPELLK